MALLMVVNCQSNTRDNRDRQDFDGNSGNNRNRRDDRDTGDYVTDKAWQIENIEAQQGTGRHLLSVIQITSKANSYLYALQ